MWAGETTACSEVVDDVAAAVRGAEALGSDEDDVHQMTDEEESERGELEQSDGGVAEVEPVHAEHAKEHGEQQRRMEVIAVGPAATNHVFLADAR